MVHVRSVSTTTTSDIDSSSSHTNDEYSNFSHRFLSIEEEEQSSSSVPQPPPNNNIVNKEQLVFGKQFTSHMLQIQYINQQWEKPKIIPYQNLIINPAASSLHYGTL
jgi:hypothetical protein